MVIRWQFTPDTGNAEATDKALIAIYNVQRKCSILWLRYASRSDEMAEITLPREWVGEHLELFMGFENAAQTWVSNIIHVYQVESLDLETPAMATVQDIPITVHIPLKDSAEVYHVVPQAITTAI